MVAFVRTMITKSVNKLILFLFVICVIGIVWILIQVITLTSFKISSGSINPALLLGDNILINK